MAIKQELDPQLALMQAFELRRQKDLAHPIGGVFGDAVGNGYHNADGKKCDIDGNLLDADGDKIADSPQSIIDAQEEVRAEAQEIIDKQGDEIRRLQAELAATKAQTLVTAPINASTPTQPSLPNPQTGVPPGVPPPARP